MTKSSLNFAKEIVLGIKSLVMKKLYALVGLLCLAHSIFAQFNWEHTGGPEGIGKCETFYNSNFAFVYDDFQLYRTDDGQSWKVINSAANGQVVVTEHMISFYSEQNNGIGQPKEIQFQLSNDNGDTWYSAPVPQDAYSNNNEVFHCTHGIYFKAGGKLYRSQTGGQSWKQVSYDGNTFSTLFSSNDKIFGRNDNKIFEFNPQSGRWVFAWNTPVETELQAIFIKGSNIIFKSQFRYYSSLNNGNDWAYFITSSDPDGHLIEKDNKVYFQSQNSLRFTEDGGQSWTSIPLNLTYQNFSIIKDKFLLFSSKVGCVLFDDSSNSYFPANQGLQSSSIWSLWSGNNQILAMLSSDTSLHKYDVNYGHWSPSETPPDIYASFALSISATGNILYDNATGSNILFSNDFGISWDTLNLPLSSYNNINNHFWIDDLIYLDGASSQFISKDFGLTWTPVSKRLKSGVIFRDQIWAADHSGKLVVSFDNAVSWVEAETEWENIISLHVADDRIFVIDFENHTVLYSSEDGISWEYSGDGISLAPSSIGILSEKKFSKHNGIYYFQGPATRLYYSIDNCSSWERVNLPLNNDKTVVFRDTIYYGRRSGGGVLKTKFPPFDREFVRGSIFHDLNKNGIKDPNEEYLHEVQIMVNTATEPQRNYFTLSNQDGQFEIRKTEYHDKLYPNLLSEYVESVEPPFHNLHDSIENYDFAVRFHPNITDAAISGKFNIQPRAGRELSAHITYQNNGTVALTGHIGLKLDPEFTYINASPPPSEIINADSLVWYFDDLPIFSKNQILVEGSVSPYLPSGGLITLAASINPLDPDISLSDNYFVIQDTLISIFVPNKKRVFPEGMTVEDMLQGKEIEYTILFQNPFDHVVNSVQISDALAPQLDYTSIRIIGSSHKIAKWELLPSGILRVFFDNMNLAPLSEEDQRSQGFLSFAIRIRNDNPDQFNISNRAHIIFEKIRTITTNQVSTGMIEEGVVSTGEIASNALPRLSIIPNPASQNCFLSTNGRIKGAGIIRILTSNGRVISSQQVQELGADIELRIDQLLNGFYLITAEGKEGIMHGKLIIQK